MDHGIYILVLCEEMKFWLKINYHYGFLLENQAFLLNASPNLK